MSLEFELHQAFDEASDALQNYCPKCHNVIFGNYCYKCKQSLPTERYFDPDWDDYAEQIEEDNEDYFKDLNKPENWTEVTDGDSQDA